VGEGFGEAPASAPMEIPPTPTGGEGHIGGSTQEGQDR
jgi:hypothetical protein